MSGVVLLLLLLAFPFGPALQNLALLLALIFFLHYLVKHKIKPAWPPAGPLRWAALCAFGLTLWNVIASALNPDNLVAEKTAYFIGYMPLVVLPWLVGSMPAVTSRYWKKIETVTAVVVLIWGTLCLTQTLWPWRWVGASPVFSGIPRAQGFYSHPLTLAYAALLIWPFAVSRVLQKPRMWQSWAYGIGALLMLIYSMSRTAQALAGLFLLWNVFRLFSGRRRWQILVALALFGSVLALTKNPVSIRFTHMIHGDEANTRFSDYPDDRLAFWHAHYLMIQDRPILGHGVHLGLDYRHPYYVKLGLADFKKQYPAHNQYIQIATEGGLIALLLFAGWLIFSLRAVRDIPVAAQTLWIFILGGLTQNAYYDSDVRTGIVILWMIVVWLKVSGTGRRTDGVDDLRAVVQ